MGIGKYFHRKKDGEGDSPQQPRRFRSRRDSTDLGTSPYATAQAAGAPETGSYPFKGNYSATAIQNPKSRSRTSSIASRFKRPSSYAGPPRDSNSAPFLPEPQLDGFRPNDGFERSKHPYSPYNSPQYEDSTYDVPRQQAYAGLEQEMDNMAIGGRQGRTQGYGHYEQSLPFNSSPQAPRADHVSPSGATMRKIEPESFGRPPAPVYQPQITTSTTTRTVTTSYPRNAPQQHPAQPDSRNAMQSSPQTRQYPYQLDNRNSMQRDPRTGPTKAAFDGRLDGPYPRNTERRPDFDTGRSAPRERHQRQGHDGTADLPPERYPRDSERRTDIDTRRNAPVERYPKQGHDAVAAANPPPERYPRDSERRPDVDTERNEPMERYQKQGRDAHMDAPGERYPKRSMDNATDGSRAKRNSIPRKPVEPKMDPSQSRQVAYQAAPTGSNSVQPRQRQDDRNLRAPNAGGSAAQDVVVLAQSNTYDTKVSEKIAPAVVHETVNKKVHHVREEQITKEIHSHDVFHRILPIVDVEVLPTRHFLPVEGGGLVEISGEEVPGRATNWVVAETASKIASDQPTPKAVSNFTARRFPGTEGDFERSIAPEGHERTQTTWVHPPTLETGAKESGQTWPFEFGERPSVDPSEESRSSEPPRSHRRKASKGRTKEAPGTSPRPRGDASRSGVAI